MRERKSVITINIRNSVLDMVDEKAKQMRLSRSEFIDYALEQFFYAVSKQKPKTLQESIIRWFLFGEWVEPSKSK